MPRIYAGLDEKVSALRVKSIGEISSPDDFLSDTYCKVRVNHRVESQAIVFAMGVSSKRHLEVLGLYWGDSEDGTFWAVFLRMAESEGPVDVQLVISDAHAGLKQAIAVDVGLSCQRCWVHSMRNILSALSVKKEIKRRTYVVGISSQP